MPRMIPSVTVKMANRMKLMGKLLKIQTSAKIVNKTLNGQVQILLNDCSMRDALKLKKCISIAPIIKR